MNKLKIKGFYCFKNGMQSNHVIPVLPLFQMHVSLPKHPNSNYMFFYLEKIKKIRLNQDGKFSDFMAKMSRVWKELSDE